MKFGSALPPEGKVRLALRLRRLQEVRPREEIVRPLGRAAQISQKIVNRRPDRRRCESGREIFVRARPVRPGRRRLLCSPGKLCNPGKLRIQQDQPDSGGALGRPTRRSRGSGRLTLTGCRVACRACHGDRGVDASQGIGTRDRTIGTFDDRSNATDTSIVDGVLTEVDGVLDNALHEDSFDWLSDTLSGAADTVEGGVESVTK